MPPRAKKNPDHLGFCTSCGGPVLKTQDHTALGMVEENTVKLIHNDWQNCSEALARAFGDRTVRPAIHNYSRTRFSGPVDGNSRPNG